MIKFTLVVSLLALLAACSGGGSDTDSSKVVEAPSAEKPTTEKPKEPGTYNQEDFVLNQVQTLQSYGQAQVTLQLNNLATDDAVYVTISSDQMDNKKLQVSPYKTILNPNKGRVDLTLNVTDQGVLSAPQLNVLVTTSGNQNFEQSLNMEFQAQ